MQHLNTTCVCGLLLLLGSPPLAAQLAERWSVEFFAGTAWSLPMPLTIRQPGQTEIRIRGRYSTRPWTGAPYYAYRFGHWSDGNAWEAELVHHKLYLENPPPEVQHFEVSHGYNLITGNHATHSGRMILRFGIGLVIAHPEGQVRNRPVGPVWSLLGGGYHIAGVTAQVSAGRRFGLTGELFAAPEAKLTASWARVPLAGGGHATVPNAALHALAGLGYGRAAR
jgi:hypothetical protein